MGKRQTNLLLLVLYWLGFGLNGAFMSVNIAIAPRKKNTVSVEKTRAEREKIKSRFTKAEKIWLLKGMILTRAVDDALKQLFLSQENLYEGRGFQGKGFRGLGQEAIYGAALKLRRGNKWVKKDEYGGDFVAPLIRDLGVFLAFTDNDIAVSLNAQMGKVGPPTHGRDLHLGDHSRGVLTPAAPLAIATATLVGQALAFKLKGEDRVAVSFIGEGGSSLGEWHEAINLAAVLHLPMIFCIEDNQRALSTTKKSQSRAFTFADKGVGYGLEAMVIDGNDVEEVAAAFAIAAQKARLGLGPILIELKTMRMCGHAHHDDTLYLGHNPKPGLHIAPAVKGGYVEPERYEEWRKLDPILQYEKKLVAQKIIAPDAALKFYDDFARQIKTHVQEIKTRPWPCLVGSDQELTFKAPYIFVPTRVLCEGYSFSVEGETYLSAIAQAVREIFQHHPTAFMLGEDVAPPYGNAFMMFKGMDDLAHRFINTPISENAIVGALVGMALAGLKPIGEMQFNDFVACAMNQVVNNASKSFFRLGLPVPLVLRMPYGGLRCAGPYHSQDTSPWFYRSPGLKIMAPSTPNDAFNMLQEAVLDPDPVLFYEHIALYRDPKIRQVLSRSSAINRRAHFVRLGEHISIITYGAYVHIAAAVADILATEHKVSADVIDLRYLSPIDMASCCLSIKKTSRALLVGEDMKSGSILQSLAADLGEQVFTHLDAPIKVLGSRDIPVPYAPSLEKEFLLSEESIVRAALNLINF